MLKITLVERDFFNLGASARNAGFLSCGNISEWLEDARELGWEETVRTFEARIEGIKTILSEVGDAVKVENCGSVDFDEVTEEKKDLAEKFNEYLLSRGSAPLFSLKTVRLGGKESQAFVNHFDSAVNPCEILIALHRKLRNLGVSFHWNTTVASIGNGEAILSTAKGEIQSVRYGYGFVCVNAFASKLNPHSQVRPARGQIIVTSPCAAEAERCLGFLRSGYDYFRFIGDRVLVGGGRLNFKESESTCSLETTPELKDYLIGLAREIIGHARFEIDFHWAGIMGLQSGRHACISEMRKPVPIDDKTEEISSCGGWGVTLSPYITRLRANSWD